MTKLAINRAPVLTLWASVVAVRLGHSRSTALTLGKAIAGKVAFSKAQTMGLAERRDPQPSSTPKPAGEKTRFIAFMGRHCTMIETASGPLAVSDGRPISPREVETYLEEKFGDCLQEARDAMEALANSRSPAQLAREAFGLYRKFRPSIPAGKAGWAKEGVLDLDRLLQLAEAKERAVPSGRS
jgi:hypothetical protein